MNNNKTEEYAIVEAFDRGKRMYIRVTKGVEPTTEIELKTEKTEDVNDFSPVIKFLNQLNEQGFELLNASLAYQTVSQGSGGLPRHTFMMIKKIK